MALASVALDSARGLLNDNDGGFWTDARLLPYLKEAFRDLMIALELNSIPIKKEKTEVSTPISYVANTTTLTIPSDLVLPIKLKESAVGENDWVDMVEMEWEPTIDKETTLRYWTFREGVIRLVGATTNRDVLLYYWKTITAPTAGGSDLIFNEAEYFLGPKLAAYAAGSRGATTLAEELDNMAETRLHKVIQFNVNNQQGLPVKRRPYRSTGRRRY